VAARHAGGLCFWADTGDGAELSWTANGQPTAGPVLALPARFRGEVVLSATVRGIVATDTRRIQPDGRVDDRSTALAEDGRRA
jgi:hypothetical protein